MQNQCQMTGCTKSKETVIEMTSSSVNGPSKLRLEVCQPCAAQVKRNEKIQ